MKIVLTGASGIGKTTLAHELAKSLNISYIAEDWGKVFQAYQLVVAAKDSEERARANEPFLLAVNQWLKSRMEACQSKESFVMDRFQVDVLKLIIDSKYFGNQPKELIKLVKHVQHASNHIDYCILLPLAGWMNTEQKNESGLIRNNDLHNKIYSQSITFGLVKMFVGCKKIYIPPKMDGVSYKIEYVMARLKARENLNK